MSFPVVWLPPVEGHPARTACWDQGFVDETLTRLGGAHVEGFDALPQDTDGAVVVVPARYYVNNVDDLNDALSRLRWVVVILTSDEESTFDHRKLVHPRMRLWIQTPRPGQHDDQVEHGRRFLPFAYPPGTRETLAERTAPNGLRRRGWAYAGQVNHSRRREATTAMRRMRGGALKVSRGFTQGLPREDYLTFLASARVAPAPSGPATPDSFRFAEALEAGTLPIADARCPAYDDESYWQFVFGLAGDMPFPVISDWSTLPSVTSRAIEEWPASGNRAVAWWQAWKRDTRRRLAADIGYLSGADVAGFPAPGVVNRDDPSALITVLIPTSPIPAHPSTAMIEETVASVRYWLPDAEIVLMIDGVRPEQERRRPAYEDYQRRLLWLASHRFGNCVPLRFAAHHHQANMTREALKLVATPIVLFVEHDTPLVTDCPIDWRALCSPLLADELDMIRLHHEAIILDEHRYLMVDEVTRIIGGCPVQRTSQWSQRPHAARTSYYRQLIANHFPPSCNTMLEDKLHSVAQSGSWTKHRLAIYDPSEQTPNNIKRSLHSDGRGAEDKYEMRFR